MYLLENLKKAVAAENRITIVSFIERAIEVRLVETLVNGID